MFVSPTVVGRTVIIGSCSGTVSSLDRQNGEVLWQYDTRVDGEAAQFHGEPLVLAEAVIIPSDAEPAAHVYSFDPKSGDLLWKASFKGGVATTPLLVDGKIVALTASGSVSALELSSGKAAWTVAPDGAQPGMPSMPSPVAAASWLYVANNRGSVFALDVKNGNQLWRRDLGSRVNTSLALAGENLYAGAVDGYLYQMDPKTGEVRNKIALGGFGFGTLIPAGPLLLALVKSDTADLVAFDTRTKKIRWRKSTPTEWTTFRPLVRDKFVIVGSEEKQLCRFALDDGRTEWCRSVPGIPRGLGLSADGVLYVGTLKGKVFAYRLE